MDAPLLTPPIWTTGTTEAIKTGTWRAALPLHIRAPAPCHAACPMGGDIAEWIGLARAHDFRAAWEVLTRHNPFPAIAGRICHHPCESACNRAGYDQAVAICKLERFVGDRAIERGWRFAPPPPAQRGRIAIIGGGPSGLSTAYQLRRNGYAVTVYEAQAELGGLMRYGIPPYRLPRAVLDAEIARIVELGIDVRCNVAMTTPQRFAWLRGEFDAVLVAIGAGRAKHLPLLDATQAWVIDSAAYLSAANAGQAMMLGKHVVVIGGGSAAFDAARSARRAGHDVTVLALEGRHQLPAQREEVAEALEEGITLADGAMLVAVHEQGSHGLKHGVKLECVGVHFEGGTVRGQFSVKPREGSQFMLHADAVIVSIGQDPALDIFAGALPIAGTLLQTDASQASGVQGVWAAGDVASMVRHVTEAVAMGQRAARAIDERLRGTALPAVPHEAVVPLSKIATFYHPLAPRAAEHRLEPARRMGPAAEVQLGLAHKQVQAESERCFSCGTCVYCDNCVHYCPDLAVQAVGGGYSVLTDYCKGCGLCVQECPTGSMKMVEELR